MRFLIVLGLSLGLSALIAGARPAIADTKLPKAPDTIVLTGTITGKDHQTYKEVPFQVPAGIGRITVSFRYGGRDLKTTIDLGLYDPHGFRGWSGGNKSTFTIAKTDATPSYLPGPLPKGTWKLLLGIPNIRANVTAEYEARITLSTSAGDLASLDDQPIRPDAGWYRGDFHAHTGHSDGVCTSLGAKRVPCPVFLTLEAAQAAGLDFIAISDHNTVSTFNSLRELQPYFDTLLVLPAREITTFFGHINAFGFTSPVDFQLGSSRLPNLGALQDQVAANHGLMSINHPALPSGEACMGCGWTVKQAD